ncbi:MAG: translation initiation factor IF-2 subunit gamma [Candidatus Methanomethylophilus sp.]|jgi:translation initiation factor 2 subunit 3|nr:translation initiation factor IF-2 subunit gamma [Methanomethylophilus sp.]TQS81469.1 MAG: translation initiation factor IF-2 subunit gamma [Methanomethylophilus alvi]WII08505.1 translation initiation factor IF-2 subunit gamma [Methanomassiliicoccales archaeon LGM-DZ1]MCI2075007.1 translation initiation factor IF-2 subunit gamma [Methanomethylophilus sp.]MCI2092349.1 translation initiation factor IF-2 subunit gamma [Methanomethylophilus sp.]
MKVPKQPEINIGMIGHVDHGKTTLTKALSGEWTDRHSEEIKRGISIRLGYADVAFYKCPNCQGAAAYSTKKKCPVCGADTEFLRAVSFVDAPGHETLMATMLSGAALMDGALLLVAANEHCPQPQTREHLMALSIIGIDKIVIVQNKIDIVTREQAMQNYREIKEFVKGTVAENAPIVPVSANRGVNIDLLIEAIEKTIVSKVKRDPDADPIMYVARSFDINSPGTVPEDIKGGVIGGTLVQGKLKIGDEIEIVPGRRVVAPDKKVTYEKIIAKIVSLEAGERAVKSVVPGGLIALGTELDPSITKSDGLTGKVIGFPGKTPKVVSSFTMKITLMDRVVGAADELNVDEIKSSEPLMLSVGIATTVGVVRSARKGEADVVLKLPVCILPGQRVAISRRISNKWRLIGYGVIEQ